MKQKSLILTIIISSFILFGCTKKTIPTVQIPNVSITIEETKSAPKTGKCEAGDVSIMGYGDKGKRLENCFVEYPGEPSRQDKSYYILEDICGQFTKEFISNVLGKPIIKTEAPDNSNFFNCRYYLNDTENIFINMEYLTIANQKKGYESMGRTVTEESKIPMKNMIVYKDDFIDVLFLVLDDKKFISLRPPSSNTMSKSEFINFAAALATEIKNYK